MNWQKIRRELAKNYPTLLRKIEKVGEVQKMTTEHAAIFLMHVVVSPKRG